MQFDAVTLDRDREAIHRIWHEVGWAGIEDGEIMSGVDALVEASTGTAYRVEGAAECVVLTSPGRLNYLDENIPLSGLMAVAASHIARKQGAAGRMSAEAIARSVGEGALVCGLGMFEQGYYNRMGFGTTSYEHLISFDPRRLTVEGSARQPVRIAKDDWQEAHAARVSRMRHHGAVSFESPLITRSRMVQVPRGFGLGYRDERGNLTHYFWCRPLDMTYGPYRIEWLSYRNYADLVELLGLVRNLGDQVRMIQIFEPPGIQFQDWLREPIHSWALTKRAPFAYNTETLADAQLRICDLPGCLARTHLRSGELKFNLVLRDPIERFLPADAPWRGVGGESVVTLGKSCGAEKGTAEDLPVLHASVNAFSRMWLGVRPATGLAATDEISGPPELLEELDWAFRLPAPKRDWDY